MLTQLAQEFIPLYLAVALYVWWCLRGLRNG